MHPEPRSSTVRYGTRILLAVLAAVGALVVGAPASAGPGYTPAERSLLTEMNRVRTAHHLAPLGFDATLQRAARAHSLEMLRSGVFAHGNFASRVRRFGARGPILGENLAWGVGAHAAPQAIVASWLASPPHRTILLRPGFRRVGVGALTGSFAGYDSALVVTADFGGS